MPATAYIEGIAIWSSQLGVAKRALAEANASPADVAAIGVTNQRETSILWDRATGEPISDSALDVYDHADEYVDLSNVSTSI